MASKINNLLIPKGRTIFFNEEEHKYTNELCIAYTSCTTIIGKYVPEKDFKKIAENCERIGRNPNHPKYLKYKGKKAYQLLKEWDVTTVEACNFGSIKHNFLETSVKSCTGYNLNARGYIDGKIYTIDDIIENHNYGRLELKRFERTGVKDTYPDIYNILLSLHKNGYYLYAEIGVYDDKYMISGLIDILAVNHTTGKFIIVDWKTNKAPMRFDAGHYEKDDYGLLNLDKWIPSEDTFLSPLSHLADSTGNHYTMQLSTYAYLVTTFGYTFGGLILCHIRPIEQRFIPRDNWAEVVEIYPLQYLESDSKLMLGDFQMKNIDVQTKMLFQ